MLLHASSELAVLSGRLQRDALQSAVRPTPSLSSLSNSFKLLCPILTAHSFFNIGKALDLSLTCRCYESM